MIKTVHKMAKGKDYTICGKHIEKLSFEKELTSYTWIDKEGEILIDCDKCLEFLPSRLKDNEQVKKEGTFDPDKFQKFYNAKYR